MLETGIRLFAGFILILTNAFFVAIEFALTRVRQFSEEEFQQTSGLRKAWEMTEELEIYLTGCQLGISVSSILLGIVAEPAFTALITPVAQLVSIPQGSVHIVSIVIAIIGLQFLHKVIGEQAPTYLGVERPKQVANYCAPVHYWWTKTTAPVIYAGDGIAKWILKQFGVEMVRSWTEESDEKEDIGDEYQIRTRSELRNKILETLSRGRISEDRKREVIKALEIGEIPVRDIMIRKGDMIYLSTSDSFEENYEKIKRKAYIRFPLFGDSEGDFVGIVYSPALFGHLDELRSGDLFLESLAAPPMTVPHDIPVSELIDRFQEENQEAALVTEGGSVVGFITATDTFEAIIGEIEDPLD